MHPTLVYASNLGSRWLLFGGGEGLGGGGLSSAVRLNQKGQMHIVSILWGMMVAAGVTKSKGLPDECFFDSKSPACRRVGNISRVPSGVGCLGRSGILATKVDEGKGA